MEDFMELSYPTHVADIPLLFLTLKVAYDLVNSKGN